MHVHRAFTILSFGAVLQAFLFLPFAWAMGALLSGVSWIVGTILSGSAPQASGLVAAPAVTSIATGLTVGTIMAYVHRSNVDADIREDLPRKLNAAQQDLELRAREAGIEVERRHLMRDWWQRAASLAELPTTARLGWHSLRRKFVNDLKGDTPMADLCQLGGWKSPLTIMTVYQ